MLLKVNVCTKSRVRILSNNDRAIHYNKLLGYKLISGQERELNQLYELDVKDYLQMGEKLNKAAQALADMDNNLIYYGDASEKNIEEINALLVGKTI